MKKFILPMLAIVTAVALSAFTSPKPMKATEALYWFQVEDGAGDETSFDNSEAHYLSGPSEVVPTGEDCNTGMYKCVIGFREDQLDGILIDDEQTPVTGEGRTRSDN